MSFPEPRRSRVMLGAWVVAVFAVSSVTDVRLLAVAAAAAVLLLRRGLLRSARRVLVSVVPLTLVLSALSWGWLRLVERRAPPLTPFLALGMRPALIAFLTFSVLERVDLFRALAPWPAATRLLAITLAQIHALRLLATESLAGLQSRLPRKPGAGDVVRSAGGVTGALFSLATRNARDVSDAMRSRGF